MNKKRIILVIALLHVFVVPAQSFVFFDDFLEDNISETEPKTWLLKKGEGPFLSDWEYTVENSWLNIWKLWSYSNDYGRIQISHRGLDDYQEFR